MITLIAESKTMTACDRPVAKARLPVFSQQADRIVYELRGMSPAELASTVRISLAMAANLCRMIYDFPYKGAGSRAIEAFTGVVFKAFDYPSLDTEARQYTSDNVRILSSIYGYLRPDDTIKAYRFDYTTRLAPDDNSFARYWRQPVTRVLLDDLKKGYHTEVLDLLPTEAARMIDFDLLRDNGITVLHPDFKRVGGGRTPHATLLKTLRGNLLRDIVQGNVSATLNLF